MASEDVLERAERGLRLDGYSMGPGAMWLIEALAAALREARKDSERLDWLSRQSEPSWALFQSATWQSDPGLRDAIDAAMGESEND